MLEQLFGSKTRVKLLRLFLNNPGHPFYLRQLARNLKSQLNSIRREVNNLEKIGLIKTTDIDESELSEDMLAEIKKEKGGAKKYFVTNIDHVLYQEVKALMLKAELLLEANFIGKIEKLTKSKLLVLTGLFVGYEDFSTDILIVGTANRTKLAKLIKEFEKELTRSINYTVMTTAEYKYRHSITDRFLYDILEGKKIVIVDKLS